MLLELELLEPEPPELSPEDDDEEEEDESDEDELSDEDEPEELSEPESFLAAAAACFALLPERVP